MSANEGVARMLEEFAEAHHALGDRYRRLAYERAAQSVRGTDLHLSEETSREALLALPHVGQSIAAKILEFLRSSRVGSLEALKREGFPRDFHAFVAIPGVGPTLARRFFTDLRVSTLDDLERAVRSGALRSVEGVSERVERRILDALPAVRAGGPSRVLLVEALPVAEALVAAVRSIPGVERAEVAGSVRRAKATIGDVDVVVATRDPDAVAEAIRRLPQLAEVRQAGRHTKARLRWGTIEADLFLVESDGWGAGLSFGTGSREHTLRLRRRAQRAGGSVKTDRVFDARGRALPAATEEAFYRSLGLDWIPPELREGAGEIEAAEAGSLPRLVEAQDLRGDLHVHTEATDGTAPLDAMVQAAARDGREYVAITDHAVGLPVPRGLDAEELLARKRRVATRLYPIPVLVGAEVNILADGGLGLEERALEALDVVIASVHSGLRDPRDRITGRIVDALSTGLVDVLGHPTNRRLPHRPESSIRFERVFEAAAAHGVALEINGSPERMDLPSRLVRRAKEHGLLFAIDSDAHAPREVANVRFGLAVARRGWLEREDVLTALPHPEFLDWLRRRRGKVASRAGATFARGPGAAPEP